MWALRILRRLLTGLGALALLAGLVAAALLWLTLPHGSDRARIRGLSAPATVRFDQDGIPRIQAATATDAAAALGYVHARDRLFQMDMMRRAASGRLSEVAGPGTLELDRMMRTIGLRQSALADLVSLPDETRARLRAYAEGVNAWIRARGRFAGLEFVATGPPPPWEEVDCLLWGKLMGLWLSGNYRVELARLALARRLSPAQIEQLWPGQTPLGASAARAPAADAAAKLAALLPAFPAPFTLPATASNEWAVDGAHSRSGAPLLAGDPHLAFGLPAIWYLARIETPGQVLAGATAPGVPFLVLGHNGRIAWSFTTTGADVQDVYEETPIDAGHYQGPDGPLAYGLRDETIHVRGGRDVAMTVRATRHGPVISDLLPDAGGAVLAVAMANLAPHDTSAAGLLALNAAGDVAAAGEAAALISSPVQNLLVADRAAIALFMTGRIPIRRAGDGSLPVPGADEAHDWTGFASGAQLPRLVAPSSGRLVNANEPVGGGDVFLGRDGFGDWRARRIRQMLDARLRHDLPEMAAMQMDVVSTYATQLLPVLRAVPAADPLSAQALALLQSWDGRVARDRPEPLIFNAWTRRFRRAVLARAGVTDPGAAVAGLEFTAWLLTPDGAGWCDGDCTGMLTGALSQSMAALKREYGPDPRRWRWGTAHPALFANRALARLPVLGPLAEASIAVPGDDSTVDRGGLAPDGFAAVHGPEFRGAYDLADLDASLFTLAPGQSGNIASAHAKDLLRRWRDGASLTLGPIPAHIDATIRLTP